MKKFKRIQKVLIAVVIMLGIITLIGASEVYGAVLKAQGERPYSDDDGDGTVGDDVYMVSATPPQNIFKIYDTAKANYPDAIYCLRGQLGSLTSSATSSLTYNIIGDMRTDKATIMTRYQTITGRALTDSEYNSILWIIDQMYLPRHVNAADSSKSVTERQEMKETLLMAAYIKYYKALFPTETAAQIVDKAKASTNANYLTEDDFEVVQQMAIWYFSNSDTRGQNNSVALATGNNDLASKLLINNGGIPGSGTGRQVGINALYRYLVEGAAANGGTPVAPPVIELENTQPKIREVTLTQGIGEFPFYVVGPFEMTKTGGDNYNLTGTIRYRDSIGEDIIELNEENNTNRVAFISNENGTEIGNNAQIDDMVGEGEFYIALNQVFFEGVEEVNLEINYSYWKTRTATYMDAGNGEQPVVLVEKEKITDSDRITTEFVDGKFNLIINKINENGELVLSDEATFSIRRLPRNASIYYTTADNTKNGTVTGKVEIKDIQITEDGEEFIYEIEETQAPIGYEGKTGKFYVRIVTEKSGEVYKVKSAEFVENSTSTTATTVEGLTIALSDDKTTVQISVTNKEKEEFDLALRKFITKINEELFEGDNSREPKIDLSKLRANSRSTATYTHSKEPVSVQQGDIVTYKIRVYNEADIDGYVNEIVDYLPAGLGYLPYHKTNIENGWHMPEELPTGAEMMNLVKKDDLFKGLYDEVAQAKNFKLEDFEGVTSLEDITILAGKVPITTDILKYDVDVPTANIIKAYDREMNKEGIGADDLWQQTGETGETDGLYYREVEVVCVVLAENSYQGVLRNIAEITDDSDDDRDSVPDNVPDDEDYYPPVPPDDNSEYHQDDDDYEPLILKRFDLSLKKFITEVESLGKTTAYDRVPKPGMPEGGFEHDLNYVFGPGIDKEKTPVAVANGDTVTYTIRVYNEGTVDGYVEEIKDDLPEGLEYLPEHQTNKDFEWKMYYIDENDEIVETDDVTKVAEIRTDYLSSAKETETRQNEIRAFDPEQEISHVDPFNPDYRDVKIAFKVVEPNSSDRIIDNTAEITDDSDDDIDSTPDNDKDGEDDIDKDYIYVKEFDLSLIKWVSKAIVTIDGKTTTTNYKMPGDDPGSDYLVKVDLGKRDVKKVTVKFEYTIRIINEGEIEGYATEITDDIPEGLEFIAKDNPLWKKDGDKVTTRALEKTLLKPRRKCRC